MNVTPRTSYMVSFEPLGVEKFDNVDALLEFVRERIEDNAGTKVVITTTYERCKKDWYDMLASTITHSGHT